MTLPSVGYCHPSCSRYLLVAYIHAVGKGCPQGWTGINRKSFDVILQMSKVCLSSSIEVAQAGGVIRLKYLEEIVHGQSEIFSSSIALWRRKMFVVGVRSETMAVTLSWYQWLSLIGGRQSEIIDFLFYVPSSQAGSNRRTRVPVLDGNLRHWKDTDLVSLPTSLIGVPAG